MLIPNARAAPSKICAGCFANIYEHCRFCQMQFENHKILKTMLFVRYLCAIETKLDETL